MEINEYRRRPIRLGARPHACQEAAKTVLDKEVAARPAIDPTRHKDAKVLQRGRVSGLYTGNTRRTDSGDEGLFDESVGIEVLIVLTRKYHSPKPSPPRGISVNLRKSYSI